MTTGPDVVPGLVSTIIPVHDRPAFVVGAVASVLAQSYRPIEIILVDDGSADGAGRVCLDLAEREPDIVRSIRRECGGPGAARETGRLLARGEFIEYLDSDDILLYSKFEKQVAMLRAHPDADIAYGPSLFIHGESGEPSPAPAEAGGRVESIFPRMLRKRLWNTNGPLWRRTLTDRLGPWTDLRLEEDLEYDARAGTLGARLVYLPEPLSVVRHHYGGRASGHSLESPDLMRARYRSHVVVYGHARRAGVLTDGPEMSFYARELFLLARQCGAVGLADESRHLFELAREASGEKRGAGTDFRVYAVLGRMAGWSAAGRLTEALDRFRRPSFATAGPKRK